MNTETTKWILKTSLSKESPSHPNQNHRNQSILWAVKHLNNRDFVILDTETTGIAKSDQIVQISMVDSIGSTLFSSLLKPVRKKKFSDEAISVHGITIEKVKDAPTIDEILEELNKLVGDKIVLAYNADFDKRLLDQSCEKINIPTPRWTWECVMLQYSQFVGEPGRKGDYRYQKLPRTSKTSLHDATEDCVLTLEVLKKMATATAQIGLIGWTLGKIFDPILDKIWPE